MSKASQDTQKNFPASTKSSRFKFSWDVKKAIRTPLCGSKRLIVASLAFFGFVILSALRTNMSIAIVCIVSNLNDTNISTNDTSGHYQYQYWTELEQGIVLGSLFYGYILTNILGGYLATRYGGRLVVGLSLLVASLFTLLLPLAVRSSWPGLIALRVLTGVAEGFTTPAMQAVLSYWAPPQESKLRSISFSGAQLGKLISFPFAAFLCDHGFDGGWPSIFYIEGLIGVIWCCLWLYEVRDNPCDHKSISTEEKHYLRITLKEMLNRSCENLTRRGIKTPWGAILTSFRVWAIILTHSCSNWGNYTFLLKLPTYINSEHTSTTNTKNGVLASIPYLFFWLVIIFSSILADRLLRRWSVTFVRKLFTAVGMLVPAVLLSCRGFFTTTTGDLMLITASVALTGLQYGGGLHLNAGDIAPAYTGIIFGISNSVASLPAIFAPLYIGEMTKGGGGWDAVFYTVSGAYTAGAVLFLFMSTGEIQTWALIVKKEQKNPRGLVVGPSRSRGSASGTSKVSWDARIQRGPDFSNDSKTDAALSKPASPNKVVVIGKGY